MELHLSDHAYEALVQAAQAQGATPEALVESFAFDLPAGRAKTEVEFYRAFGLDNSQIKKIKEDAEHLPLEPDW